MSNISTCINKCFYNDICRVIWMYLEQTVYIPVHSWLSLKHFSYADSNCSQMSKLSNLTLIHNYQHTFILGISNKIIKMGFKYETWKGKYKRNNSPFCQMPGICTTTKTWHELTQFFNNGCAFRFLYRVFRYKSWMMAGILYSHTLPLPTDEDKLAKNHGLGILYYRDTIYTNTTGIVCPCLFIYSNIICQTSNQYNRMQTICCWVPISLIICLSKITI